MKKRNGIKIAIVVMSVLLVLLLAALAVLFIYLKSSSDNTKPVSTVSNNEITQSKLTSAESGNESYVHSENDGTYTSQPAASLAVNGTESTARGAAELCLYKGQSSDNTAFCTENMLPGDSVSKCYNVKVSYRDNVTVRFKADITNGEEVLGRVLKTRVRLLGNGEILYDGLMRDMQNGTEVKLSSGGDTAVQVLCYEITAYLDTTVGNEFADKQLLADFKWWVDETENLGAAPATGEIANIAQIIAVIALSAAFCIILCIIVKRGRAKKYG